MQPLKSFQKKYLRGLAHGLRPVVQIGQKGISAGLMSELDQALETHELIKIKFNDVKTKGDKLKVLDTVCEQSNCELVALLGHVSILYRRHQDRDREHLRVPVREVI